MTTLTVERATRPQFIPGKGISFPEMAELQKRLAPHLRNMPPILIRGHSTKSDPSSNHLMISPKHLGFNSETMSDAEVLNYFHVLLTSVWMVSCYSRGHAREIKNGALPLISFYRVPDGHFNLEEYGHDFIGNYLRLLDLPNISLEGLEIKRVSSPSGREKIGDIVFKDPFFTRERPYIDVVDETFEQKYFEQQEAGFCAYYEALKMLLMLAECNWEPKA